MAVILPHTLSIITTHQCTAACEHCCFTCTPYVTKAIPHDRLHRLIDETVGVPSIKIVVFTGGECFFLGEKLDDLIARAAALQLNTRVVTNGHWAVTRQAAHDRVLSLASAGLSEMNISTGVEHERYVARERVVHAALAPEAAGMTTLIAVEIQEYSDFGSEYFIDHDELGPLVTEGRVILIQSVWIENGGDSRIAHAREHSRFRPENISGCNTVLNVVSVTPDMELIACCGLHMARLPELALGSVAKRTLGEGLAPAPDDLLKMWIHVDGQERILHFVKQHAPEYELPLSSSHPCETCLYLYEDQTVREVLFDRYQEEEERVVNLYLNGLASNVFQDRLLMSDPGAVRVWAAERDREESGEE